MPKATTIHAEPLDADDWDIIVGSPSERFCGLVLTWNRSFTRLSWRTPFFRKLGSLPSGSRWWLGSWVEHQSNCVSVSATRFSSHNLSLKRCS
jgi:hypothetical protein